MLRIVKHLAPLALKVGHGVANHGQVLLEGHAEDLRDMERPGFADHRDDPGAGLEKLPHLRIILHFHPAAASHAEGRDLGVSPRALGRFSEEFDVLGIRARPPALDVIHPELVQTLGHPQFVLHAERNPRSLRAIPQGGVINRDCGAGLQAGLGVG